MTTLQDRLRASPTSQIMQEAADALDALRAEAKEQARLLGPVCADDKIQAALDRMERAYAGHSIGADKADDPNGYQGGFVAGFRSCLNGSREALK